MGVDIGTPSAYRENSHHGSLRFERTAKYPLTYVVKGMVSQSKFTLFSKSLSTLFPAQTLKPMAWCFLIKTRPLIPYETILEKATLRV